MERRSIRLCTIGCLSVTHKPSATAAINLNRGHTIFKPLYIALKLEFIEVYCDLKLQVSGNPRSSATSFPAHVGLR